MKKRTTLTVLSLLTLGLASCVSGGSATSSEAGKGDSSSSSSEVALTLEERFSRDFQSLTNSGNYTFQYTYKNQTFFDYFNLERGYLYQQYQNLGLCLLETYSGSKLAYTFTYDPTDESAAIVGVAKFQDYYGNVVTLESLDQYDAFKGLRGLSLAELGLSREGETLVSANSALRSAVLTLFGYENAVDHLEKVSFSYEGEALLVQMHFDATISLAPNESIGRLTDLGKTSFKSLEKEMASYENIASKQGLEADVIAKFEVDALKFSTEYYTVKETSGRLKEGTSEVSIDENRLRTHGTEIEYDLNGEVYSTDEAYLKAVRLEGDAVGRVAISALTGEEEITKIAGTWESLGLIKNEMDAYAFKLIDGETNLYRYYGTDLDKVVTDMTWLNLIYDIKELTFDPTTMTFVATSVDYMDNAEKTHKEYVIHYEGTPTDADFVYPNPIDKKEGQKFQDAYIKGKLDGSASYRITGVNSQNADDTSVITYTPELLSIEDRGTTDYRNVSGLYKMNGAVYRFEGHREKDGTYKGLRYQAVYEGKEIKDLYQAFNAGVGVFKKESDTTYVSYRTFTHYDEAVPFGPDNNHMNKNPEIEITVDGTKIQTLSYWYSYGDGGGQDVLSFEYENVSEPEHLREALSALDPFVTPKSWSVEDNTDLPDLSAYQKLVADFGEEKAKALPYLYDEDFIYSWIGSTEYKTGRNYVFSSINDEETVASYVSRYEAYLVSPEIGYVSAGKDGDYDVYLSADKTVQIAISYRQSDYLTIYFINLAKE